jgi:hypothetical protein
MATAVLFISWKSPHPGMHKEAYRFFSTEALAYLKKNEGKAFERMEMFALTPHGGAVNGGVLLFGERAKLDELRRTDDFEAFSIQLGSLFSDVGVVPGLNFEGIQGVMARMEKRS